jgi:hypothetical protein
MKLTALCISFLLACPLILAQNSDCATATTICSNQSFSNDNNGEGSVNDEITVGGTSGSSNFGCLGTDLGYSGEVNSSWYYFSPLSTGTIQFALTASSGNDYDFVLWGPFNSSAIPCPPNTLPLRCSASDGAANNSISTGLGNGATDTSESPSGDDWLKPLTIGAGDVGKVYILCINKFTPNALPFTMDWTGTTANLNCTPLPILLTKFSGQNTPKGNELIWETASEHNADYYELYYSSDGKQFSSLSKIAAIGNSTTASHYAYLHENPVVGIGYYKLKGFDTDGKNTEEKIIVIDNKLVDNAGEIVPNPNNGQMLFKYKLPTAEDGRFELQDLTGRVVYSSELKANQNALQLQLNLPKGMYYYKSYSPAGNSTTGRMIVQ